MGIAPADWEILQSEATLLESAPEISKMEKNASHRDKGVASHILFAACKSTETAMEVGERGLFTRRLIEVLKGSSLTSSYASIIREVGSLDE